jgi:hypothetical protein
MHVVCRLLLDNATFDEEIGVDLCQVSCISELYKKTNYAPLRTFESVLTISREVLHQLKNHISTVRFETSYLAPVEGKEHSPDSLICLLHLRDAHDNFMAKVGESINAAKERILESHRPLNASELAELAHFRASIHSPIPRPITRKRKFDLG